MFFCLFLFLDGRVGIVSYNLSLEGEIICFMKDVRIFKFLFI